MSASKTEQFNRRAMLAKLGLGVSGVALATQGCDSNKPALIVEDLFGKTETGTCVLTPTEAAGPYPLYSVRNDPAMTRREIHEDQPGVPVHLQIKLFNVNNGCEVITDAEVYIWHCDKDGVYSGYAETGAGAADKTFCRGIQPVDEDGVAHFDTIYPGWYPGRVTHMHFQIYHQGKSVTSQLAFPLDTNRAVYETPLYKDQGQNYTVRSLSDDFEFEDDGAVHQTVTVSGDPESGLTATLEVGIRA